MPTLPTLSEPPRGLQHFCFPLHKFSQNPRKSNSFALIPSSSASSSQFVQNRKPAAAITATGLSSAIHIPSRRHIVTTGNSEVLTSFLELVGSLCSPIEQKRTHDSAAKVERTELRSHPLREVVASGSWLSTSVESISLRGSRLPGVHQFLAVSAPEG